MPWNSGAGGPGDSDGHDPWGSPGANGGGRRQDPPGGPRRRPGGPWGVGGGPGGVPPDLDQLIAGAQAWARRVLPGGSPGGRGLALLALVVVAIWLASGFYRVQPDEQGVVLRFGAFVRTTPPGLNYHIPWPVETVLLPAVTRINRIEVGYRGAGAREGAEGRASPARDVAEESLMLTGDENIIDINFTVFWRIRDAGAYLFNTRNPANTVKSAAESVMREVIGRTPIQPALTEARARIEQEVMTGTQAILDQYRAGVEITQVQLQKVDPPAAVIDSFRDVQRANTDAERMRNEAESYRNDIVPRARGDAARITAEAEGAARAAVVEAQGQAQRFESVLGAYQAAKDVTLRRLYIETMQDVLSRASTVVVDDQARNLVPFLPLGTAPPSLPALPSSPSSAAPAAAAPRSPAR